MIIVIWLLSHVYCYAFIVIRLLLYVYGYCLFDVIFNNADIDCH